MIWTLYMMHSYYIKSFVNTGFSLHLFPEETTVLLLEAVIIPTKDCSGHKLPFYAPAAAVVTGTVHYK